MLKHFRERPGDQELKIQQQSRIEKRNQKKLFKKFKNAIPNWLKSNTKYLTDLDTSIKVANDMIETVEYGHITSN